LAADASVPAADAGTPAVADPDAPTVAARVDHAEAHVGDALTVTVTAVARRGVPVNLPNVHELGAFSLLDRSEAETDPGDGRLRQRVIVRPGPPPRPAHEIALERLDRLGAYGFLENADNRPFYFAVSEIIRDYLGGRFGFDSLELTTDELMEELTRRADNQLV